MPTKPLHGEGSVCVDQSESVIECGINTHCFSHVIFIHIEMDSGGIPISDISLYYEKNKRDRHLERFL